MPRIERSVVFLCITVVALAAMFPGVSALDYAVIELSWALTPDPSSVAILSPTPPGAAQSFSLLSLLPTRAPPA
jgi:hypothetical protein